MPLSDGAGIASPGETPRLVGEAPFSLEEPLTDEGGTALPRGAPSLGGGQGKGRMLLY